MLNSAPLNSAPLNTAGNSVPVGHVTGGSFKVQHHGDVTGGGVSWAATAVLVPMDGAVTGQGFLANATIYGASDVTGAAFSKGLSANLVSTNEAFVTGRGFTTVPTLGLAGQWYARVTGRGFASATKVYGGASVTGGGFTATPAITLTAPWPIHITGGAFTSTLKATVVAPTSITVTGGTFKSTLWHSKVTGRGFATAPVIEFAYTPVYAEAFVMNILTTEVSRYQNYPFMHVARLGTEHYGFTSSGIYHITGTDDELTPVNGKITTMQTDFDCFQSKNVPYLYANIDLPISVTPYIDNLPGPKQNSLFSGRKVKLGRGNKGRYWYFLIENISTLYGVEYLPERIQRRVK